MHDDVWMVHMEVKLDGANTSVDGGRQREGLAREGCGRCEGGSEEVA